MNLPISWGAHAKLTWKRGLFLGLGVLLLAAMVFLALSGRWRLMRRLMWWQKMKQAEIEAAKLEAQKEANQTEITKERHLRENLEREQRIIEKKRVTARLEVDGMDHSGIVKELRKQGF